MNSILASTSLGLRLNFRPIPASIEAIDTPRQQQVFDYLLQIPVSQMHDIYDSAEGISLGI